MMQSSFVLNPDESLIADQDADFLANVTVNPTVERSVDISNMLRAWKPTQESDSVPIASQRPPSSFGNDTTLLHLHHPSQLDSSTVAPSAKEIAAPCIREESPPPKFDETMLQSDNRENIFSDKSSTPKLKTNVINDINDDSLSTPTQDLTPRKYTHSPNKSPASDDTVFALTLLDNKDPLSRWRTPASSLSKRTSLISTGPKQEKSNNLTTTTISSSSRRNSNIGSTTNTIQSKPRRNSHGQVLLPTGQVRNAKYHRPSTSTSTSTFAENSGITKSSSMSKISSLSSATASLSLAPGPSEPNAARPTTPFMPPPPLPSTSSTSRSHKPRAQAAKVNTTPIKQNTHSIISPSPLASTTRQKTKQPRPKTMSDIELSSLMPPPLSTIRHSSNSIKKPIPSAGMFTYDIFSHSQQNSSSKRSSIGNNKYGFATNTVTSPRASRPPVSSMNASPSKRGSLSSRPPPSPSSRTSKTFLQR